MLFEEAGYRIVSWDMVTKTPKETEFNVHCCSVQDQAFLDWICEHNPEAHTYQFIVKASPNGQFEALDTVQKLEAKIGELTQHNKKLKSQISWLESHRFGSFSSLINQLRNKNKN